MPTPTQPPLAVAQTAPRGADVLVVGLTDDGPIGVPAELDAAYTKAFATGVADLARSLGAKTGAGKTRTLPALGDGPRILVVGVGAATPTPEDLRRAAGAGVRQASTLADGEPLSVVVSLGADEPETLQAVAEGALLGLYEYAPVSGRDPKPRRVGLITVLSSATPDADLISRVELLARAVVVTRDWVNTPPNLLYPQSLADQAKALVRDAKIGVEVLDDAALVKGGYGGIMAVGGGSSRPPRLVRLSYAPRGASFHLALVGKGITFDSGGLNLKPGESMYTMKCDMAGAATVIAATDAIARLGLKVKVTTYACLAENLPSDTAFRPSDVLTMYGGKTVENGNTDAEGRLVMADALARASEDEPDLIVDVATLTGAAVVALGDRTAALMATDDTTADRLLDAAESAGEELWQLPIPREIRPRLDSSVADLRSTAKEKVAGALVAAAFLRDFVGEDIAWAHLDIAGPAYNDRSPYGHVSAGGTGFGVRTLVALAAALA
ncbi:leucyl aminopeptidase [Microlunatus ginsengisoli]|uniref:Probable cytosol aminopeptidase n=1 Tax=Microlunatus ginsengisoli TaxID=363863 RepID=A0ABP6ZRR5_9ACTN